MTLHGCTTLVPSRSANEITSSAVAPKSLLWEIKVKILALCYIAVFSYRSPIFSLGQLVLIEKMGPNPGTQQEHNSLGFFSFNALNLCFVVKLLADCQKSAWIQLSSWPVLEHSTFETFRHTTIWSHPRDCSCGPQFASTCQYFYEKNIWMCFSECISSPSPSCHIEGSGWKM